MDNGLGNVIRRHRGVFAVLAAGGLLLGALACEDSDKVPPADSTISLAASPATILLSNGIQDPEDQVTILATVYNSIGVPLKGQDVRFTMNSGVLTPTAGTPVRTDDLGNAVTFLNLATTTTTITAKSGTATADIQLQTLTCAISTVDLDVTNLNFTSCVASDSGGKVTLTATVLDTGGDPCVGVSVIFKSQPTDLEDEDVHLNITPGTVRTNSAGKAETSVTLVQSECELECPGQDCNPSEQTITATAGSTTSQPSTINIAVP